MSDEQAPRDHWSDLYDNALPDDAEGSWIRRAIDAKRESTRERGDPT